MIFTPFFTAVYIQKRLILQTIYVLNKEILQKNSRFIIKSGFKSIAGYDGACTVHTSQNCKKELENIFHKFEQFWEVTTQFL